MFQEKEGALAVLSLDGHVEQSLSVGHSVVDRGPRTQQLGRNSVHTWQGAIESVRKQTTEQNLLLNGYEVPVQRARPRTVWSMESLRLKSGMIWRLLVA